MRNRFRSLVSYSAASATILLAAVFPLALRGPLVHGLAGTGLRVSPHYLGGGVAYTLHRDGYQIDVHHPVFRGVLGTGSEGFVQLTVRPAASLPAIVSVEIALRGDDPPDMNVRFSTQADAQGHLHLTVEPRTPRVLHVLPMADTTATELAGPLILPLKHAIVIRVPIRKA